MDIQSNIAELRRLRNWVPDDAINVLITSHTWPIDFGNENWQGWKTFGESQIFESVELNSRDWKRWQLPEGFASMYRELGIDRSHDDAITTDELAISIAFAKLESRYLLLMPSCSVAAFEPEGFLVNLVANHWADLSRASLDTPMLHSSDSRDEVGLVGKWIPVESNSISKRLFPIICATIHIRADGSFVEHFPSGKQVSATWKSDEETLTVDHREGTVRHQFRISNGYLEINQIGGDFHCKYRRDCDSPRLADT